MPAMILPACVRRACKNQPIDSRNTRMKTYHTARRVAHSAEQMFALVADVESYPQFLPLCEGLVIRSRETTDAGEVLLADMSVSYKFFNESFTSRVTLDRSSKSILVEYVDGPFRHLENRWNFHPDGESACQVEFYIAYEFASRSMQMLMGAVFERAFKKFVGAFEQRADEVYGSGASAGATLA